MLSLATDEVHIHLLRPELAKETDEKILDSAEQQRAQSFKFKKDRDLYVAAHVFLRQVLSRYAAVSKKDWQFVSNAYGKPAIANLSYGWLQFNLSHTHGRVACAVAHNRAVGIDVEQHRYLSELPLLCRSAFSSLEAENVLSAPHRDIQIQRFFSYWTLKEAYIKARGMGLSLPLQQFSFVQDTHQNWQLHYSPNFQDDGKNWQFSTCRLGRDHHLAYCVQTDDSTSSKALRVRVMEA
ncbi:4'-phosphopantetheinyl transferase [Crenothrix polyspora]|uniref:4'-phosphopantetheinyl transferase n=1 Tax=Crenothrix polyspora TaxID=360316 RepID=A0A1R4HGC5_9GAMM|nr:4'-phosphopantetheinyl transferase superfamily protein [Crenothrix polyspora]SJM94920.1 4'-phosphopantetheinyl transferase [Crenothrix polyspora]